jgi:hypothetical protein
MEIKLHKLLAENFQGASFVIDLLDGQNAVITAANGVGKTRTLAAFTWSLRGKNSEGKADFNNRTLDQDNNIVPGLVTKVESTLSFDDEVHVLRREEHEKIVKKEVKGYETKCYIDDVPKSVTDYEEWLEERLPEDTAKMLTDLYQFNRDTPEWGKKERRAMLLALAGKIGTPKGFDKLIKDCAGRTVAEYKQVLQAQKKRHEDERDDIGPALNECNLTLQGLGDATDTTAIEAQRKTIQTSIDGFDKEQEQVLVGENARTAALAAIAKIELSRATREIELQNDTTQFAGLVEEKGRLGRELAEHAQQVQFADSAVKTKQLEIDNRRSAMNTHLANREKYAKQYTELSEQKDSMICSLCGQSLPADKIAEAGEKKAQALAILAENGKKAYASAKEEAGIIETLTASLKTLTERHTAYVAEHAELEAKTKARITEIETKISNREKPKKEDDFTWKNYTAIIEKAKAELPPSSAEQLTTIAASRKQLEGELAKLNTALANVDTAKRTKDRIEELKAKQITLSQAIADIEKQLANIGEFTAAESALIETSVNKMFKHTKWKLFETALNGNIEPACTALFDDGKALVPYPDASHGQQILVGVDIISVLSKHYGINIILFVDNEEALSYSLDFFEGQLIRLRMVRTQKALKIEVEQKAEKQVA